MSSEKTIILYVDDEEHNLTAFRANFRKEYEIYTALSAKEALVMLEENKAHIIIADERMPEITGVNFLAETAKRYPASVRLLITGQADINVVIEAINAGQISKFIQKPWDWDKLAMAIDHCVTIYKYRTELEVKNEKLERINEDLNKFVYSVSHDLRSPLTSILGLIKLTKMLPEMRVADGYFDMIEGRVLKLDNFIKKLIDYYKNERVEEVRDNIDFNLLISDVLETLKNPDDSVAFEVSVNQNVVFIGDQLRLTIILENLISNSIKYQNSSAKIQEVKIKVEVDKDMAIIRISDNGIGIKPENIKNIFNLFFRAEGALHKDGAGIGLYIVKEAVTRMKGKIEVNSETMVGTSFEIFIPNIHNGIQ